MRTTDAVLFEVDACKMWLNIPDALVDIPIGNLRKIMKWQARGDNQESLRKFFGAVQETEELLKLEWEQRSRDYLKNYKSPDFDQYGHKITDKKEIKLRQGHNKSLLRKAEKAKNAYDRFKDKRKPKLLELREMYIED